MAPTEFLLKALRNRSVWETRLLITASITALVTTALFIVALIGWHRGICLRIVCGCLALFLVAMIGYQAVRERRRP
jgi:hypothetical protein